MFWIIILAILSIAYWEKIVSCVKKGSKQPEPVVEKITFTDNYTATPVKVIEYIHYDSSMINMKHKNFYDRYYTRYYACTKVIIFSDGGRESVNNKGSYWSKWLSLQKGCICSLIQKKDDNGLVVESYYLPSAPASLFFDTKTGKVML